MSEGLADNYGLSQPPADRRVTAPALAYEPRDPQHYRPAIGVIGCGGISAQHLNAYRHAGYRVAALCNRTEAKARERQRQFYPEAEIYTDYRELLARADVEVVDITTHPAERAEIIAAALRAGKHVLSQKPFVLDLEVGEQLCELADTHGVKLAVNQNGRWSPHYSYLREAVAAGLIGEVTSATFTIHWDHNWISGTPFERIDHLILSDFGIHWFDLAACFFQGREARRVYAATARAVGQCALPPMLASAVIEFDGGLATLAFNADVTHGQQDRTFIAGTRGSLTSVGPSLSEQKVTLHTADGTAYPELAGTWFREGFHGAMAELLAAIAERREPINSARENLPSLALCFAAVASAAEGLPQIPGRVRQLPNPSQHGERG